MVSEELGSTNQVSAHLTDLQVKLEKHQTQEEEGREKKCQSYQTFGMGFKSPKFLSGKSWVARLQALPTIEPGRLPQHA